MHDVIVSLTQFLNVATAIQCEIEVIEIAQSVEQHILTQIVNTILTIWQSKNEQYWDSSVAEHLS